MGVVDQEGTGMGKVLWMINHYAGLPSEPRGTRHYWLSRGLQEQGWDVRIIRSGPADSRWTWRPSIQDVGGVEVTTLPGPSERVRGAARLRSWAAFAGAIQVPEATRHLPRPDVVVGSSVHLGAAWGARRLARRHRAQFVFEVRDLWPETLIALGVLKRSSAPARAMFRLERSLARSASLIVSPLSGVGEYMEHSHGIPLEHFVWISNGVRLVGQSEYPQFGGEQLRLQYFGSLGPANDVSTILDAVALANGSLPEPCLLQVIGRGPYRERLIAQVAADPGLRENVAFPDPVPSSRVPEAMGWGNAVVIQVPDMPELYRYGISQNKLFEYLASAHWLIMGSKVDRNPAADAPGAVFCEPDARAIGEGIVRSAQLSAQERMARSKGNLDLVRQRYEYFTLAGQLDSALTKRLESGSGA